MWGKKEKLADVTGLQNKSKVSSYVVFIKQKTMGLKKKRHLFYNKWI